MDSAVYEQCSHLQQDDFAFLKKISRNMPLLADLSRADLQMYCRTGKDEALVIGQARPHSVPSLHSQSLVGERVSLKDDVPLHRALMHNHTSRQTRGSSQGRAPSVQSIWPLVRDGRATAALSIETNLLEHERHRRRSSVFRRSLRQLQEMAMTDEIPGIAELSPFGEHDGVMVVDAQRRIQYMSGIATNLYRKLGYQESIIRRRLSTLETSDHPLVSRAMRQRRCLEADEDPSGLAWVKKIIPLYSVGNGGFGLSRLLALRNTGPSLTGCIITVHDATDTRRKERELKIKSAMIQEIHHRVKNNLQTIAALLRLQARRVKSDEAHIALQESINRILSVAVVHEFLSEQETHVINLKEVSERLLVQIRQTVNTPHRRIRLLLEGPELSLPAQQATACALIINELLQNAVEHGLRDRAEGAIIVRMAQDAQEISITVKDDGRGLPPDFSLESGSRLGLRIVQTLVQDDLKGRFLLESGEGVHAGITFPVIQLPEAENDST